MNEVDFINAYIKAFKEDKTTTEFARDIGRTYNTVFQRIRAYKRMGINLPNLRSSRPGSSGIDIAALNKLIEEKNK